MSDLFSFDPHFFAGFFSAIFCLFCLLRSRVQVEAVMNSTALSQLDCVKNKRLYDVGLSGMNAWFEAKTVEPHVRAGGSRE